MEYLILGIITYFYCCIVAYNYIIIFLHNIQEEMKSKNDGYEPIRYIKSLNPFFLLKFIKN